MKRSRSYIDMLNDKLKEEPSTDPRVVSSYLKFIVMLDFLAVATVVPLLPQYFARSVRVFVCGASSTRGAVLCVCVYSIYYCTPALMIVLHERTPKKKTTTPPKNKHRAAATSSWRGSPPPTPSRSSWAASSSAGSRTASSRARPSS